MFERLLKNRAHDGIGDQRENRRVRDSIHAVAPEAEFRQRFSLAMICSAASTSVQSHRRGADPRKTARCAIGVQGRKSVPQQDLTQGMETGTHDSIRHGVNWGPAYQARNTKDTRPEKKGEPKKTSD